MWCRSRFCSFYLFKKIVISGGVLKLLKAVQGLVRISSGGTSNKLKMENAKDNFRDEAESSGSSHIKHKVFR